jgi:molybdopterin molybdotransferase
MPPMNVHVSSGDACAEGALLSIEEACARAAAFARPINDTALIRAGDALDRVAAQRVEAEVPLPPFDQSAMDGYALLANEDLVAGAHLTVIGRLTAGSSADHLVQGSAARIFTGAPLPLRADTVVMQEHVCRLGAEIILERAPAKGDNIRRRGEDVAAGEELIARGERIDARHLALLASQGLGYLRVYRRPRAVVMSTGDELVEPGSPRGDTSIFDSNRFMLMALARQAGFDVTDGTSLPDDPRRIAEAIAYWARHCDLIVTTGGASNGDEDHAAAALSEASGIVEILKIAVKPGKPAVVGRLGAATFLGLPGNPVAALVAWMLLGAAVTSAMFARPIRRRRGCPMTIASDFIRRPGRTEFVPARRLEQPGSIEILGRGGSARLRPLALADGLAEISPLDAPLKAGSIVALHPFSGCFAF